jgi:hypothetical protein
VAYLTKGEKPARLMQKLCPPGKGLMVNKHIDILLANQVSLRQRSPGEVDDVD